jgi:hypothetical protein
MRQLPVMQVFPAPPEYGLPWQTQSSPVGQSVSTMQVSNVQ